MNGTKPVPDGMEKFVESVCNNYLDIDTMGRVREHFADLYDMTAKPFIDKLDSAILAAQVELAAREAEDNWRTTMIRGHVVRRGVKEFAMQGQEPDGTSWMRWVVIERKNGTTYRTLRRIAAEAGIQFDHAYNGPGRYFHHPGGMTRRTRTRVIFTYHGGLDI